MDSSIRVWGSEPTETSAKYGMPPTPSAASYTFLNARTTCNIDDSWRFTKSLMKSFEEGSQTMKIFDLSSKILSENQLRKKFKKKDLEVVNQYRHAIDVYTGLHVNSIASQAIDHVVELQFVSYTLAKSLCHNQPDIERVSSLLKPSINIVENLNVTEAKINIAKMNIFKIFLREKIDHGIPILSLMVGTLCEKYMHGIRAAFEVSFADVRKSIDNIVIDSGSVSLRKNLKSVCQELDSLYISLRFDEICF
jgi:hypothetical protein